VSVVELAYLAVGVVVLAWVTSEAPRRLSDLLRSLAVVIFWFVVLGVAAWV